MKRIDRVAAALFYEWTGQRRWNDTANKRRRWRAMARAAIRAAGSSRKTKHDY